MPLPRARLKPGRKAQDRSRGGRAVPHGSRTTALIQGTSQVQINDGHISVVGGDSHTHIHYHGTKVHLESILQAIPNLRRIHQDILARATADTGLWLLRGCTFQIWLEPNGEIKILWGSGIPGAGKTILASLVIELLEALARESEQDICVAYVYIRYSDSTDMTVRSILEILLRQTVERHPGFLSAVQQVYAQHIQEGTQPTEVQLLGLLQNICKNMAVFYVLDALDEAPTGIQLDLVKKLSSLDCKLFITSRPLKALEAHFPSAHRFPIVAQDRDVDLLIEQKLENSLDLQELLASAGSHVREEIFESIKQKCGGMFLHASLQLDSICHCLSINDVRQTLKAFPTRIEDAYDQTWRRILNQSPNHVWYAKTVLLWVVNAQRSMTVEELRHAVAASSDDHKFDPSRLVPGTTLISLCCGLVTVEEESKLVRLVHYTAQETLGRLLTESFPHPHSVLSTICINHLSDCGFPNTTINSQQDLEEALKVDPLLAYAHSAWGFHAKESLDLPSFASQLTTFVSDCHAFPQLAYGTTGFDLLGPLHLIIWHNFPLALAGASCLNDPNVQTKEQHLSPLGLACGQGHLILAQELLSLPNIQVNATNKDGLSPLMLAALGRHDAMEVMLKDGRTEVNLRDHKGWTAIMLASQRANVEGVRLLLSHPEIEINVVTTEGSGHSALMCAALGGNEDLIRLFLAHPTIDANLIDRRGWSPLMCAAKGRFEAATALLVAYPDINVNLVDFEGWSALCHAVDEGCEPIVKLLLAHPNIDVNLKTAEGWSALLYAADKGCEPIVKLLLAHPNIDVNLKIAEGWSALTCAAARDHGGTVEILLSHPDIDVNLTIDDGWSPIMFVVGNSQERPAELLLAHPKVNVNNANLHGTTPLLSVSESGHARMVKLLLAAPSIDVNAADSDGNTALKIAAQKGHEDVVQLLLEVPGIDITIVSTKDGHTAMSAALADGHHTIVRLLEEFESGSKAVGEPH